jgi:adenylate cyclase
MAELPLATEDAMHRRSAALVFADVVGYSRLMATDELGTYARVVALYHNVLKPAAERLGGYIGELRGDGALLEFADVHQAVQWAHAAHMGAAATGSAAAPPLVLRIAIHMGGVLITEDGVFGDAVNLTARLQAHAAPGGTVVSEAVAHALRDTLDEPLVDLGLLRFKNDERPFHAYALGTAHSALQLRRLGELPSIAVLPLSNVGGDPADAYLAAGIMDDVILSLSGLRELAVIARGSTTAAAGGQQADPVSAGQALGVRYVLSGSLRRAGPAIRVSSQLTNVETGQALWADCQSGRDEEVFDLQDHIVQRIVAGMAPNIRASELRAALRKRPESLTAYDSTLRGVHLIYSLDKETSLEAKAYLDQAMAEDPGFPLPMAYSAWWHVLWIGQRWVRDVAAAIAAATNLSTRAIALDPGHALALSAHGQILSFLKHEHEAAMVFFDRALESCPNHAFAWMWSSGTLAYLGRGAEAVARAEHAMRLSPLDQARYLFDTRLALAHYANGDLEAAVRFSLRARDENPNFSANLRFLAAALGGLGRREQAEAVVADLLRLEPDFRLSAYERGLQPFTDTALRERFLSDLRAAGVQP